MIEKIQFKIKKFKFKTKKFEFKIEKFKFKAEKFSFNTKIFFIQHRKISIVIQFIIKVNLKYAFVQFYTFSGGWLALIRASFIWLYTFRGGWVAGGISIKTS